MLDIVIKRQGVGSINSNTSYFMTPCLGDCIQYLSSAVNLVETYQENAELSIVVKDKKDARCFEELLPLIKCDYSISLNVIEGLPYPTEQEFFDSFNTEVVFAQKIDVACDYFFFKEGVEKPVALPNTPFIAWTDGFSNTNPTQYTAEDKAVMADYLKTRDLPLVNTGVYDFRELIYVLKRAERLVSFDSGIAHFGNVVRGCPIKIFVNDLVTAHVLLMRRRKCNIKVLRTGNKNAIV